MTARFADRVALVTGASRGLGRALAVAFGREGAFVWVGFRSRADEAAATVAAIEQAGGEARALQIDVGDRGAVEAAVAEALRERERIDVLVNNAGIARDALFPAAADEDWGEVLAVNLTGTARVCRAVVRPMIARRKGAIVNVASVAGLHASPGQSGYAASKGGVLALTRTLAVELAAWGIRVNAVVPGMLATGMAARMDLRVAKEKIARIPLGRAGEGAEVAEAALFLASDAAGYVVGQALVVDGGLTL